MGEFCAIASMFHFIDFLGKFRCLAIHVEQLHRG